MKSKLLVLSIIFGLILSCETKKEEVEVGGITERTPEEVANYKEFAPEFVFNSIEGKQVALKDLKGKYVYIDIWATWCRPCLEQLPAMKELEEKYRGTGIEFMSISVDSERDKEKWQKMVKEKDMKGIQLFAGSSSSFNGDYQVQTIPRFLIIGKEGELIDKDAPRPMDFETRQANVELITVLDELLKK